MSFVIRVPGPVGPPPQSRAEYPREPDCEHPTVEVRGKAQRNGVIPSRQCTVCGAHLGYVPKAQVPPGAALPAYDDDLRRRWWEDRHERAQAAFEAAKDRDRRAWQDWYAAYLLTPQWRAKRAKVLERDKYVCAGCGAARAEEVHHLTYDRVGREMLFDLVAVCAACHRSIHEGR